MKFYVPNAKTPEDAEGIVEAVHRFILHEQSLPGVLTNRRANSLHYRHDGKTYTAAVGEPHPETGQVVVVIVETNSVFGVCTIDRGVARGIPVMVGHSDVYGVEYFDGFGKDNMDRPYGG